MKLILTVAAYLYWPLFYGLVYVPFIVPRLRDWSSIPLVVLLLAFLGFGVVCISLGAKLEVAKLLMNALGIASCLSLFDWLGAGLNWPSFGKSYLPQDGPAFYIRLCLMAAGIAVLFGAGRLIGFIWGRNG